ncbi:MAG: DUF1566 domain-containing protein [Treponema sp.]|jgi:hypothetical protein|nr:DUF1566 domain-containing protein [Treponema sp.]
MKKTLLVLFVLFVCAGLYAQQSKTYKVGDTGPAGGIVFYDKGNDSDGWRYLEAAPAGAVFTAEWGAYGQDAAGTSAAVGTGRSNTEIIAAKLSSSKESGRAAQVCSILNIKGFNDWFLPSKDELNLMYRNLKQKGLGNFNNDWYWSSSQAGDNGAWNQNFRNGYQEGNSKNTIGSVRAIRAFQTGGNL